MGVNWCFGVSSFSLSFGLSGMNGLTRFLKALIGFKEDILDGVIVRVSKWTIVRKEFQNLNSDLIMHNWQAYIVCGPLKGRNLSMCSPPLVGMSKFMMDGVARGKPLPAGHMRCTSQLQGLDVQHTVVIVEEPISV